MASSQKHPAKPHAAPGAPDAPARAVRQADSAAEQDAIAHAIQQLTPAEAEMFLHKLERAVVHRRIQLWGYLSALIAWAVAMFFSLAAYGGADPHSFRAWILALPFVAIGVVLYAFGWLADRARKAPPQ